MCITTHATIQAPAQLAQCYACTRMTIKQHIVVAHSYPLSAISQYRSILCVEKWVEFNLQRMHFKVHAWLVHGCIGPYRIIFTHINL